MKDDAIASNGTSGGTSSGESRSSLVDKICGFAQSNPTAAAGCSYIIRISRPGHCSKGSLFLEVDGTWGFVCWQSWKGCKYYTTFKKL